MRRRIKSVSQARGGSHDQKIDQIAEKGQWLNDIFSMKNKISLFIYLIKSNKLNYFGISKNSEISKFRNLFSRGNTNYILMLLTNWHRFWWHLNIRLYICRTISGFPASSKLENVWNFEPFRTVKFRFCFDIFEKS